MQSVRKQDLQLPLSKQSLVRSIAFLAWFGELLIYTKQRTKCSHSYEINKILKVEKQWNNSYLGIFPLQVTFFCEIKSHWKHKNRTFKMI